MPSFIGFWELIALAVVLLLLFGPKRLPEIGRSLGSSMREFRESLTHSGEELPESRSMDSEAPGAPRHVRESREAARVASTNDAHDAA